MYRFLSCFLLSFCCSLISCSQEQKPVEPVEQHLNHVRDTAKHLQEIGNKQSALIYQYKVHALAKQSGMKEHQARALLDIASIIREDSANRSLEHLYDALVIAGQLKNDRLQSDIYLAISETYKRQKNFEDALKALEVHRKLVDSLVIRDNERTLVLTKAEQQRTIGISITIGILLVLSIVFYYYRRMRRLNAKLHEINEVKNQLFSVIGHDLRGPARSLVQALELLEQGSFSKVEKKEVITAMLRQSRAFYDTVETLFRWANSQQHGISLQFETFNPAEVISNSLSLLEGQAAHKGVTLVMTNDISVQLTCDRDHFDFVIRNLLSNAIKFSNVDGVVKVSADVNDGSIVFSISDSGVGMSATQLAQLDSNSMSSTFGTAGEKGTGLGLQLSRRMIIANHGRLWVESIEGSGTTVLFSIPLNNTKL